MSEKNTSIALTLADSDSRGAYIQTSLTAFSILDAFAVFVMIAIVAKNTQIVSRVELMSHVSVAEKLNPRFIPNKIDHSLSETMLLLGCSGPFIGWTAG